MTLLETKIAILEANQKNMSDDLSEIKEIVKAFDTKLDKALEKKADIWVEKAISWFSYTVIGVVVLALLNQVVNK